MCVSGNVYAVTTSTQTVHESQLSIMYRVHVYYKKLSAYQMSNACFLNNLSTRGSYVKFRGTSEETSGVGGVVTVQLAVGNQGVCSMCTSAGETLLLFVLILLTAHSIMLLPIQFLSIAVLCVQFVSVLYLISSEWKK
jgi:hypothetical protein